MYELDSNAAVAEWLTDEIREKHGIETGFYDYGWKELLYDDIRAILPRGVREYPSMSSGLRGHAE